MLWVIASLTHLIHFAFYIVFCYVYLYSPSRFLISQKPNLAVLPFYIFLFPVCTDLCGAVVVHEELEDVEVTIGRRHMQRGGAVSVPKSINQLINRYL